MLCYANNVQLSVAKQIHIKVAKRHDDIAVTVNLRQKLFRLKFIDLIYE